MTLELINYSEFNTLTDCERKFVYAYLLQQEEEGAKRGLHLGTLCHLWHSSWLRGEGGVLLDTWTDDINTGGKPGEERTLCLKDFDLDLVARALWLRDRFIERYGPQPPSSWTVISAEEWMTREFTWGKLVGRSDGWVDIDGSLTLVEVKSYASRPGPLAYAQVSPQLGCYSLLAEEKYGQVPDQVLYQGIYTHRWKQKPMTQAAIIEQLKDGGATESLKDLRTAAKRLQEDPRYLQPERPVEESFDQLELVLGEQHLRTAETYLEAAVNRRREITSGHGDALDIAMPSVGAHCGYCGFKQRCWFELGGVEEFEIEVEDDDAEPV